MEKELIRIERLLYEIVCDAGYAMVYCDGPDAARFCTRQYRSVVSRLQGLVPGISVPQVSSKASPGTIRMAARSAASTVRETIRQRRKQARLLENPLTLLCTDFLHAMGWS